MIPIINETASGLVAAAAGAVICWALQKIAGIAIIEQYKTEYRFMRIAVDSLKSQVESFESQVRWLESDFKFMHKICMIWQGHKNEKEQKKKEKLKKERNLFTSVNYELGFGTGDCPCCGKVLFNEQLIKEKTLFGDIFKCPKCELEL